MFQKVFKMIPEFSTTHLLSGKRGSQREHTACPVIVREPTVNTQTTICKRVDWLGVVPLPTHPCPFQVHFPSFHSILCKCGCSCLALLLDFRTHRQFLTSWPLLNFSIITKSFPPPGQASQWVVRSWRKRFSIASSGATFLPSPVPCTF